MNDIQEQVNVQIAEGLKKAVQMISTKFEDLM
jgi:hypothetical protein